MVPSSKQRIILHQKFLWIVVIIISPDRLIVQRMIFILNSGYFDIIDLVLVNSVLDKTYTLFCTYLYPLSEVVLSSGTIFYDFILIQIIFYIELNLSLIYYSYVSQLSNFILLSYTLFIFIYG